MNYIKVLADESVDEKIYCTATVEDNFEDDKVIVILNEEASMNESIYNEEFFSEYNCEKVINLNFNDEENIQDNINNSFETNYEMKKTLLLCLNEKSKLNVLETIDQLIQLDGILYAGPDYVMANSMVIDDTYKDSQWANDALDLPFVWDFSTGFSEIKVGILDSGIDGSHPDLVDSIDTELCRDFTNGEEVVVNEPVDPYGHGTHVAGIIGATGDNGIGISGVNWNVSLVSLRVIDDWGYSKTSSFVAAINYAIRKRINVLNCSMRWYPSNERFDLDAINIVIQDYPGIIICSAGNEGIDNDGDNPAYPASYNLDNIISVGAIDSSSERSIWSEIKSSNYGENTVDIYAPGSSILSTYPEEYHQFEHPDYPEAGYCFSGGTSMAAPYVTGVVALLMSISPDISLQQIKTAILTSADNIIISVPNENENSEENEFIEQSVLSLNAYEAVKYVLSEYLQIPELVLNSNELININDFASNEYSFFIDKNILYKLTVSDSQNYEFIASSDNDIIIMLYDDDFNLISYSDMDLSTDKTHFIKNLSVGTYYLRAKYVDEFFDGIIDFQISSGQTQYINQKQSYSILLNYYNNITSYQFDNPYENGFYKFSIIATAIDGSEINYPSNALRITDDDSLIQKYNFPNYNNYANTSLNENAIVVYLNTNHTYNINISMEITGINELKLIVEDVSEEEIDLFDLDETTDSNIQILDNQMAKGDYFEKIDLKQAGKFDITYSYDNVSLNNCLFIFGKIEYDATYSDYVFNTIITDIIDNESYSLLNSILLLEGTYYVGYFNKDDTTVINFALKRSVTSYGSEYLDIDPNYAGLFGTEVTINGGEKNSNEITQGFTRLIYLSTGESRLSYYWYSSDETVARITDYGTVMALDVSEDTIVKIMAVNINNPSKVYVKEVIIKKEIDTFADNPIEYTLGVTINKDECMTQQININSLNVPIKWLQYYDWNPIEEAISVSKYGIIDASNCESGVYHVIGTYVLNERVRIYITVTVI